MKGYSRLIKNVPPSGISNLFDELQGRDDILSLGVGEPDFSVPQYVKQAAMDAIANDVDTYTFDLGTVEIRSEIAAYLKRRFDADYELNEMIVTNGCSNGLDLVIRCLVNPEDEVVLTNPGYVAYAPIVYATGGKVVELPLSKETGFKVTPEALKSVLSEKTKLIILNFPSNPTGGIMSYDDYAKIVPLLKENGCYILSDEIYCELIYEGVPTSLCQFKELKDQLIVMNGFSKTYAMTGYRLGYLAASKELISFFRILHCTNAIAANTISQRAGAVALREGDKDIPAVVENFRKKRDYIVTRLNNLGLATAMPQGAFYAFANVTKYYPTGDEFVRHMIDEAKVAVIPGSAFGSLGTEFVRFSYAYSMEQLQEALDRVEKWLNG